VYDEDGTLRFLEGYITDITTRKQDEQIARERYAELAHALRVSSIGEIAGSIAHELNQPLSAIVNFCQGALMRIDRGTLASDQMNDTFHRISLQAERAGQILHRVNRFVRKEEPARRVVDLHELVNSALDLVASELQLARVSVHRELNAKASTVYVDGIQIEQVLVNLCRNAQEAMSATPPEDSRLTIRTESRAGEVETVVIDSGCGCPPEVQHRLFEPFFSSKPQGMGLGLSICKSIIEAHGGRAWATSNTDGGMALHFTLPLLRGH
jgi:C4-dicarboxylate-specific signal transduction histidine kinase